MAWFDIIIPQLINFEEITSPSLQDLKVLQH